MSAPVPTLVTIVPEEQIPEEWEPALFEALVAGTRSEDAGHEQLLKFVLETSVGVPRVQQEALRHLAFRLPSSEPEAFLRILVSPDIPTSLRVEFFEQVLAVRPPELLESLSVRLAGGREMELAGMADQWLESSGGQLETN